MTKIFPFVAGNTLNSHQDFLKKLTKKGAKEVPTIEDSTFTIVFCPIVSRFETDVNSALSSAAESGCTEVILVAMHHTFNKNYSLPNQRMLNNPAITLLVDCLFFERKGLLKCPCNKKAYNLVREKLGLKKSKKKKSKKKVSKN